MTNGFMPTNWLETLDAPTRAQAAHLLELMHDLGAPEAETWVYSEITENIPQVACFRMLKLLWTMVIDSWRDADPSWIGKMIDEAEEDEHGYFADAGLALKRLRDAGAKPEDLSSFARFVAYESVFGALMVLEGDRDGEDELGDNGPNWGIAELDENCDPTGRFIEAPHESLLSMDPSGNEGKSA